MADKEKTDAKFLVEEFGISPQSAAELVTPPGEQADELARTLMSEDRAEDRLAEQPVPASGKDPQHEETGVQDFEKPIDHSYSAPT